MSKSQRCLFVVPHPDDLELSCGILVQKLVAAGYEVKVVIVCTGVPFSRAMTEREAEAIAGCKMLGVSDVTFLRHASFRLAEDRWEVKDNLEDIVKAFVPTVLFIPWQDDLHEDHATLSALCLVAGRSIRTTYFYPAISAENFIPDTIVLGTRKMLELKVRAIAAHVSQVTAGRIDPRRAITVSDYWLENFGHHSRSRVHGIDKKTASAEVLKLYKQELDL